MPVSRAEPLGCTAAARDIQRETGRKATVESMSDSRDTRSLSASAPARPRKSPALAGALALFAVGALAVAAIFAFAAVGAEPPLALYLASLLFPLGLIAGVLSVVVSTVLSQRRGEARR
jgi:hypothetical protein